MKNFFTLIAIATALAAAVAAQSIEINSANPTFLPPVGYPAEAMKTGLKGRVSVLVLIDKKGEPTSVRNVSGPDFVCPSVVREDVAAMRTAAEKAAMRAKFTPATENGRPVASSLTLTYDFNAPEKTSLSEPQTDIGVPTVPQMVSGGILNGKATSLPKPIYPADAIAAKATGTVTVKVLLEQDGSVFSAEPVSGNYLLQDSARTAACRAVFAPTRLAGHALKVNGLIVYNFVP